MDFQSRINSFRQGLNDQQDSYNRLAANTSQLGRTLLPDRVGAHLEYMEKIGGSMTGAFAGLHGGIKIAKKITKYRASRAAKANNQQSPEGQRAADTASERATTASERATSQTAERTVNESARLPSEMAKTEQSGSLDTMGGRGEVMAKVSQQGDTQSLATDIGKSGDYGSEAQSRVLGSGGGAKPEPTRPAGTAEGEGGGAQAEPPSDLDLISKEDAESLFKSPEDDTRGIIQQSEENPITAGGEGGDSLLSRAGEYLGKKFAGGIADTIGEVASEAIPVVGELAGLGMLIHGIVKAHRHEKNDPDANNTLSAPTKQATEQAGGFSADMFKGGSGMGIV